MDKPPIRPSTSAPSAASHPPSRSMRDLGDSHEEKLPALEEEDKLTKLLHGVIHIAVKILAVLMVLVILWGVADVAYVMYQRLTIPEHFMLLTVTDILAIFGSFMAVLIAIEIFINITLYIKRDVLPIKMVIATALMAISRKVIMLDFKDLEPLYIFGIAAVIVALGVTYWLISYKPQVVKQEER
ncbi:MAG: phosphate-starvation-inducible PsiE family protein [Methylococcaceae bacterium]|nr:phosphate-starvation-inducible PsiE family protein [Methylococcaceae bacterium]